LAANPPVRMPASAAPAIMVLFVFIVFILFSGLRRGLVHPWLAEEGLVGPNLRARR
jgi:hypothetical protein